ncbi:PAS-domain containing protein [Cereibacter azotoformans]|uniref:histidine kinase n=1 Tax=Cereibacter azotoformans TaxID=43057 RepID=A0A2T5KCA5_9RHOB|nr:PAS-domain containing protein [Cereibacter azotoformans]AXQ94096.1 response regulator [Cereibacter sphaeroides]MBO4168100.1 PAS-domain containing protein [Cereibacter azotoformans]PTR20036.1 PAS domain-containing protein [Cereibacter azotoformans]UIJ29630.1 PAS-domain containing protein [Cereibacter azotoformans]
MPEREEALEALTRAGLNLIQQALSIYDSDLKLAVWNRRFREMFDLPERLATSGADFTETIRYLVERGEYGPVDDPEQAVRTRVAAARTFQPHYMERERPSGRWISVEGAPLPQGGWVTVYTDITEIKLQESLLRARSEVLSGEVLANAERLAQANRALAATNAALEEAQRELTEMEARTRLTTEMMPAHIAHVGRDLRYTYSNRRLSQVIPGRPSDILGLTGREALGDEVFARIRPCLLRALEGEPSVLEFTAEDSGTRIRSAFTPDRIGEGPINGVYILSMDVTAETQAREALIQTRKRELTAQLTSGLAHDFANLLTVILGLQGRLERMDLSEEGRQLVAATIAAARRGGGLLDQIASISGKRALNPVATVLARFLSDLRLMAGPTLPDGVALEIVMPDPIPPVMLDAGALQDAALNLILNARDAIGGRGGTIRLTARAVRDTWIEILVEDDGPGFSEPALEHALDPFFTTKGGVGSGLGLSMVYDQIKLAGGTVRIGNRPGGGAAVQLRLPLRRADEPAAPMLVLLVEDDPDIREAVRGMLRAAGHSVIEAASADEALTLIDLPGVGLVLSDVNLPGQRSGLDLAAELAARTHPARLVLMTSLPPGNARRQSAEALAPVLAKPFDATQLAACLGASA